MQQVSPQQYSPHWKTLATYQIVRSHRVSCIIRSISETVMELNPSTRRKHFLHGLLQSRRRFRKI